MLNQLSLGPFQNRKLLSTFFRRLILRSLFLKIYLLCLPKQAITWIQLLIVISCVDEFGGDDLLRACLNFMQDAEGVSRSSIGSSHVERFLKYTPTDRFHSEGESFSFIAN